MIFKGVVFYHYSEDTMRILENLQTLYEIRGKTTDTSYLQGNARKINIYLRYLFSSATMYLVMPIVIRMLIFSKIGKWAPIFPTDLWFPFNPANYYVPVYIFHVVAFMLYFICSMSTETLIFMILNHISQHFKHLANDLEHLDQSSNLRGIVDQHNLLLG